MSNASITAVYEELKSLRKEVELVRNALIPEEEISQKEMREIRQTLKEMKAGKEKTFQEIFRK
ncbi:MAG: hypothetical protein HY917_01055 [Candidatus Diapherotrites archaeon]|nr:hypothetical protein [Candidatus Diapherotrites archaeon]